MGRKPIRNLDKKIIREVWREAYEGGVSNVLTKQIASHLRVSEPVIFAHYKTKTNLLISAFDSAWNAIPHNVVIPSELTKEANDAAFLAYQKKVGAVLADPLPSLYVYHFMASEFYANPETQRILRPYHELICQTFERYNGALTSEELDMLAERFIESSVSSLAHMLLQEHPHDEKALRLYYGARLFGFVGVLGMKGSAFQKLMAE